MSSAATGADTRRYTLTAMVCAAVMMAHQVGSRATRDTLFLSSFPVAKLPLMVVGASVLSIVSALVAARVLTRAGPARVIPVAFAVSGVLTFAEWWLALGRPAAAAVLVYLHVSALAPVLLSGFWSILNEHFDPREAKREMGTIAAIGTLGGLAGGVLAERVASWFGVAGTLAALGAAHLACAAVLARLVSHDAHRTPAPAHGEALSPSASARLLAGKPYLRNLALLVLGSSVSASLLDFVFKAQSAGAAAPGLALMRLFTAFYAVVALFTFAIQALATRWALERAGLTRSIGVLPGAVVAGGALTIAVPGPWSVGLVRGIEAVLRGSLFRSGYELLYTPIPSHEKRATKAIIDVGLDRAGDMVGAAVVGLVLILPAAFATRTLLGLAVVCALATLVLVARLQRGYVSSLEAGLRAGAMDIPTAEVPQWATSETLLGTLSFSRHTLEGITAPAAAPAHTDRPVTAATDDTGAGAVADEVVVRGLRELRSADPTRVRAALGAHRPLDPALTAQAIELLAWDDVVSEAIPALREVAPRHVGQLLDALLDPESDFTVRRRIPSVLAECRDPRAVEGLVRGLADARFEVRYRCGYTLARMLEAEPSLRVEPEVVFETVRREARVGRTVWNSQKLLEQLDERGSERFVDQFVRARAGRSLEHVFTLLSLVLPREPLRIAFLGLQAEERALRGLALEYLESVLPESVRAVLWPHLEGDTVARVDQTPASRDREAVLNDLLRSNLSMELDIEKLRRAHQDREDSALF